MSVHFVEVVARSVEVGGDQVDRVEPVLGPVGLGLDEEHLLGQTVGTGGLVGVAVPERGLAEGDRRHLGILAGRADGDELEDPGQARLFHELEPHERVLVEQLGRAFLVEPDAADLGREVDDHLRVADGLGAVLAPSQVGLGERRADAGDRRSRRGRVASRSDARRGTRRPR